MPPIRTLTALCLTAALAAPAARADSPIPAPAASAPAELAGVPFGTMDFDWRDESRSRSVPVRLYLPDAAAAGKPVPLVVFSHGIGGSRMGYSYLGRYWASQGYASLHLQHVGSDRNLWFGNVFGLIGRLQGAAQDSEAIDRVKDLSFALDQLGAGPLAPRLDLSRIVAAGHSYGANTTLLAAGARVERQGRTLDFRDPRIKAAIIISAPPFYGDKVPQRILASVTIPTLHITATDDVIRIPGYYSGADDRLAVFDATGSARKVLAMFEGGSHSMFTDRAGTGGATLNPQVKAATQELSLAFLRQVFEGDAQGLQQWPERFRGIVARFAEHHGR